MIYTGRKLIASILAITMMALTGCGSGNNEEILLPGSTKVSGSGLLGIISGAIVTALVPSDRTVLAESATQVDGTFDLDISLSHTGPILIEITPASDDSSTFLCDFPGGCPDPSNPGTLISFGGNVPFTSTLSAAVSGITSINNVNINPITTAIVARTEELGGITNANLNQANSEMSEQLALLLGQNFPTDVSAVPNINLVAPQEGSAKPFVSAGILLASLNSGLISLISDDETIDDVILDLADGFAPDGELGASANFNSAELGSNELLFAAEQTISSVITTQPAIVQILEEIVPSLNLSEAAITLKMMRNEIVAIPPAISGLPEAIALEDASYSFTPTITDADDTSFTFSVIDLPDWASFDDSNGTISGIPLNANADEKALTSISVSDGFSTTTLGPFTITVKNTNDAPIITGAPPVEIAESATYQFVPSASDEDVGSALSFSISPNPLPEWLTFNAQTGELSGKPQDSNVGTSADIIITVSDGEVDASLAPFSITVTNIPPSISGVPGVALEDSNFTFTPISAGGNNFSVTNLPVWATFDPVTGAISGKPANANVGIYSDINISLSDLNETVVLRDLSIEVINTNDAPEITGTPTTNVQEDAAYAFTPLATDVDVGDTLSYKISSKPQWATFDASNGTLAGTPRNDDVAVYSDIVISVVDAAESVAQIDAFSIQVTNTNDAPTITGTSATEVLEDSLYTFAPLAEDVDISYGDEISLSLTLDQAKPDWLSFDEKTGVLSGSPDDLDVGTLTNLVITVTDGEETASLPAFNLTITNIPPTITGAISDATEDAAYSFTPTASGGNTFIATNLPAWASINATTGEITGTPLNDDVGITSNISIALSDANETVSLTDLSLRVINTNDAPTLTGMPPDFAFINTPYRFILTAGDVDLGDTLLFTDNLPPWATLEATDPELLTIVGTPTTTDLGRTTVLVTADDLNVASATEFEFVLEVTDGTIINLTWDNPTNYQDGSPLIASELFGYEMTYVKDGELPVTEWFTTGAGGSTTYTSPLLELGSYTFSVRVFDSSSDLSEASDALLAVFNN